MKILILLLSGCAAQGCVDACTTYYKDICENDLSFDKCKTFCTTRFRKICDAKCEYEDKELTCQCLLPESECPKK